MKIFENLYKVRSGLFCPVNEVEYSLTPRNSIIEKEEWARCYKSFDNSLYQNWYTCERNLEEYTVEEFSKIEETMTLKDLKLIYEEYPFLMNLSKKNASNSNGEVGVGVATGVIIGKML